MRPEELNALATRVLDAAFQVHSALGPGLLESAYTACLVFELAQAGVEVRTEVPVPVVYKGVKLAEVGYKIDLLIARNWLLRLSPCKLWHLSTSRSLSRI